MRPPTRSTRSVRIHSTKTTSNPRRSRRASGPPTLTPLASSENGNTTTTPPPKPRVRPQRPSADGDVKVDPGTSPGSGSVPAPAPQPPSGGPVIGCFPAFPPSPATAARFVLDNDNDNNHRPYPPEIPLIVDPHIAGGSPLPFVSGNLNLRPPRPRHRMSSEKLETLDAFFRRKTHPSRKEKEAICKDLDVDIKTVTIWFQNKRQTMARSRKLLQCERASSANAASASTTAMDMLASASAKMSPLVPTAAAAADVKPFASSTSATTASVRLELGSDIGRPRSECSSSPGRSVPRLQRTKSLPLVSSRPPLKLSAQAVAHDSNVFESVRAQPSSPCRPDIRSKPHLGHDWQIHPEDLWKHIPSSPALPVLSSPDVSPDIDTPSRSSRFSSVRKPLTLEWACARSAKRRRTNPGAICHEDGESDSESNSADRSNPSRSSFTVSEARVPLECYDKYPLDVVRGAVLLLGLRDARRGLGI